MKFDTLKIRNDFPILQGDNAPIYFDNACSTLRPKQVIQAVTDYYEKYPVCAGRSKYRLSDIVTKKVEDARKSVAKFVGAKAEEIVFTRNATESINLVSYAYPFKQGDVILISDKEHNSNLIPWQVLAKNKGIKLKTVKTCEDGAFDMDALKKSLEEESVTLASFGATSNLDGVSYPIDEIVKICHKNGAMVLLDCAQWIPHKPMNFKKLDADFVAFSGHKMCGPSGMGALAAKYELLEKMNPFMTGGSTVEFSTYETHQLLKPPAKFEAGLQDYSGIIGFGAAAEYISGIDFDNIAKSELELNTYITSELLQIDGLRIIGPQDPAKRGGIISFTAKNIDTHQIAMMADKMSGIMIRSGQHCVHSWFRPHGVHSTARASVYFYNTMDEARKFAETIKKIISLF